VFKKVFIVAIILGATIVSYFFILAMMPLFRDTASIAATAPSASNFTAFKSFVQGWPWFLLAIPAAVALIASILVMRQKEVGT